MMNACMYLCMCGRSDAQLLNLRHMDNGEDMGDVDDIDARFLKLLAKLRMEEILDFDSFEKKMHGLLGAALDDVRRGAGGGEGGGAPRGVAPPGRREASRRRGVERPRAVGASKGLAPSRVRTGVWSRLGGRVVG